MNTIEYIPHTNIINKYNTLERVLSTVVDPYKRSKSAMVQGRGGTSKSSTVKTIAGNLIKGGKNVDLRIKKSSKITHLGLYNYFCSLCTVEKTLDTNGEEVSNGKPPYIPENMLIVLDDLFLVDGMIDMFKEMLDSTGNYKTSYDTSHAMYPEFYFYGKLIILTNTPMITQVAKKKKDDVLALITRFDQKIKFDPTDKELFDYALYLLATSDHFLDDNGNHVLSNNGQLDPNYGFEVIKTFYEEYGHMFLAVSLRLNDQMINNYLDFGEDIIFDDGLRDLILATDLKDDNS